MLCLCGLHYIQYTLNTLPIGGKEKDQNIWQVYGANPADISNSRSAVHQNKVVFRFPLLSKLFQVRAEFFMRKQVYPSYLLDAAIVISRLFAGGNNVDL